MRNAVLLFPNRERVYTTDGTDSVARGAANDIVNGIRKIITVETADWSAVQTTGWPHASDVPGAQAVYADVVHDMNSDMAYPVVIKGDGDFLISTVLHVETIDSNTTRVWILAAQAPPYDVVMLFLG